MLVSLSSISLSILPSSSCGPMYCPGLSGEGTGSMGLGRNGSGRLGRSKAGQVKWGIVFVFQRFDCEFVLLRVRIVSSLVLERVKGDGHSLESTSLPYPHPQLSNLLPADSTREKLILTTGNTVVST